MIVVRLMGGLGNQLFQYAAGRQVAELNQTELLLDTTFLTDTPPGDTVRDFELDKFNVVATIASSDTIKSFGGTGFSLKDCCSTFVFSFFDKKKYKFNDYGFDARLLRLRGNYYIRGFFQSDKYFNSIESLVRKDLTIRSEFISKDFVLAERIRNTNSVSIHIRRGDYIRNLSSSNALAVCSKDYYVKSINYIKSRLGDDVHFYIFTDDEEWVRREMKWDINSTLITGKTSVEDFYFMSMCKSNIIANSTFSWWAAWLNDNPDKIVVMPKHWTVNHKTEDIDLKPPKWIIK